MNSEDGKGGWGIAVFQRSYELTDNGTIRKYICIMAISYITGTQVICCYPVSYDPIYLDA